MSTTVDHGPFCPAFTAPAIAGFREIVATGRCRCGAVPSVLSMGGEDTLPTPLGRMSDAVAVAHVLRDHDPARLECADHDGLCCPQPGCSHGFRDAGLHQALALLADPRLRDAMVRAVIEHDAHRTLSGPLSGPVPPRRGW